MEIVLVSKGFIILSFSPAIDQWTEDVELLNANQDGFSIIFKKDLTSSLWFLPTHLKYHEYLLNKCYPPEKLQQNVVIVEIERILTHFLQTDVLSPSSLCCMNYLLGILDILLIYVSERSIEFSRQGIIIIDQRKECSYFRFIIFFFKNCLIWVSEYLMFFFISEINY